MDLDKLLKNQKEFFKSGKTLSVDQYAEKTLFFCEKP